jgi:hypothetical protein
MTDNRRTPTEFLHDARKARANWDDADGSPIDPATAEQMRAADRDARRIMGQSIDRVIDVEDMGEREIALLFAITAAARRRGEEPRHGLDRPRPELVDLFATGRRGHCDVCDARAHRLEEMHAQYGPYIFRARICVRCRRFGPAEPVDGEDRSE